MSNLREVHYEKHLSDFDPEYFKEIFIGNYEIIDENSNRLLKKIENKWDNYIVKQYGP